MLSGTADGVQVDWAQEGGVEAFGQREALTTRIRHVLGVCVCVCVCVCTCTQCSVAPSCADAYTDGPGVLIELLQNADDAGATRVAFCLDEASYPANSILGVLSRLCVLVQQCTMPCNVLSWLHALVMTTCMHHFNASLCQDRMSYHLVVLYHVSYHLVVLYHHHHHHHECKYHHHHHHHECKQAPQWLIYRVPPCLRLTTPPFPLLILTPSAASGRTARPPAQAPRAALGLASTQSTTLPTCRVLFLGSSW